MTDFFENQLEQVQMGVKSAPIHEAVDIVPVNPPYDYEKETTYTDADNDFLDSLGTDNPD